MAESPVLLSTARVYVIVALTVEFAAAGAGNVISMR
jgi:hypothetical protein